MVIDGLMWPVEAAGDIDVLINNALVRYFSPIEKFKPEDWDRALSVNLSAAFHTVRLALPGMRLASLDPAHVDHAARIINNHPRRHLGDQSPASLYAAASTVH